MLISFNVCKLPTTLDSLDKLNFQVSNKVKIDHFPGVLMWQVYGENCSRYTQWRKLCVPLYMCPITVVSLASLIWVFSFTFTIFPNLTRTSDFGLNINSSHIMVNNIKLDPLRHFMSFCKHQRSILAEKVHSIKLDP